MPLRYTSCPSFSISRSNGHKTHGKGRLSGYICIMQYLVLKRKRRSPCVILASPLAVRPRGLAISEETLSMSGLLSGKRWRRSHPAMITEQEDVTFSALACVGTGVPFRAREIGRSFVQLGCDRWYFLTQRMAT